MRLGLLVRKTMNDDNFKNPADGTYFPGYTVDSVAELRARYEDAREYLGGEAKTNKKYREYICNPANRPNGWDSFVVDEVDRMFN